MHRTLLIATALGVALIARNAAGQATAPTTLPDCQTQLAESRAQSATIEKAWQGVNQKRVGFEIQEASLRATLGPSCPDVVPLTQCVATLQERLKSAMMPPTAPPAASPAEVKK